MFAALGTKVTVVEQRERMLEFCDVEVVEALKYHLRDLAVTFRFGERVSSVEAHPGGAIALLASGKRIPADTVMYSAGRQGQTVDLDLAAAGLTADKRGRITVDEFFQTSVPHIYAVGDVIGFPALAATSMEQGRLAAHHACGEPVHSAHQLQPIGIYSIPEISFIGKTEDELTRECVPFEVGRDRARAHRPGRDGLRRHRRLPGRRRVQLPDPGRVLQGRGPGRDQQDARGRALLPHVGAAGR
jgi:NAD(P) transhydrogenase